MPHALKGAPPSDSLAAFFLALPRVPLEQREWRVLMVLRNRETSRRSGTISLKYLMDSTGLGRSSISRAVSHLIERGIVTRSRIGRTQFSIAIVYDPSKWADRCRYSNESLQIQQRETPETIYIEKDVEKKGVPPYPPTTMSQTDLVPVPPDNQTFGELLASLPNIGHRYDYAEAAVERFRKLYGDDLTRQALLWARDHALTNPIAYAASILQAGLAPWGGRRKSKTPDKATMSTIALAPASAGAKEVVAAVMQGARLPILDETTADALIEAEHLITENTRASTTDASRDEAIALICRVAQEISRHRYWARKTTSVAKFREHYAEFFLLAQDKEALARTTERKPVDEDEARKARVLALMKKRTAR